MSSSVHPFPGPGTTPEDAAYGDLFEHLERTIRRICPPWLVDSRDDLVQMAMLKVMDVTRRRRASGSEQSGDLSSSYLWRLAHSVLIDEIRRIRRRGEVGLEVEEVAGSQEAPPGPGTTVSRVENPQRQLAAKQIDAAIWNCLGGLAESRRLAVTLHLEGTTPAEAAQILGWGTKKVYNAIHRGLADLRGCLQGKGWMP